MSGSPHVITGWAVYVIKKSFTVHMVTQERYLHWIIAGQAVITVSFCKANMLCIFSLFSEHLNKLRQRRQLKLRFCNIKSGHNSRNKSIAIIITLWFSCIDGLHQLCSILFDHVDKRFTFSVFHQPAQTIAADWFIKCPAMCYHIYVMMHVKDPQLSVVRVGHCVIGEFQ